MYCFRIITASVLATGALGMVVIHHMHGPDQDHASPPAATVVRKPDGGKQARTGEADLASRMASARHAASTVEPADPADAAVVERLRQQATERLVRLQRDLDLNATQQRRILGVLMAHSAPPGIVLTMGGKPVNRPESSIEDAIHDELDPERARIYQETLLDDAAWWEDAFAQIEEGMNESTGDEPHAPDAQR
jgi:hypothetical protein